jgi:hypothetical protein
MHKNAMKCNETLRKWCKNKHGASKIIDTFETYQGRGGTKKPNKRLKKAQRELEAVVSGPMSDENKAIAKEKDTNRDPPRTRRDILATKITCELITTWRLKHFIFP